MIDDFFITAKSFPTVEYEINIFLSAEVNNLYVLNCSDNTIDIVSSPSNNPIELSSNISLSVNMVVVLGLAGSTPSLAPNMKTVPNPSSMLLIGIILTPALSIFKLHFKLDNILDTKKINVSLSISVLFKILEYESNCLIILCQVCSVILSLSIANSSLILSFNRFVIFIDSIKSKVVL